MNEKESKLYSEAMAAIVTLSNTSVEPKVVELATECRMAINSYYRCTKDSSKNKRVARVQQITGQLRDFGYGMDSHQIFNWAAHVSPKTTENDAATLGKRADAIGRMGVPASCARDLKEMKEAMEVFDRNSLPNQRTIQKALAHFINERCMALEFSEVPALDELLLDMNTWFLYQQSRLDIVLF